VSNDPVICIGVLTPHAARGPADELGRMAPGQVITRVARILAPRADVSAPGTPPTTPSGLRALTAPAVLDAAAGVLTRGSVDVIGYASTSTGYAIGFDAEATMLQRLSERWSLPVAGTSVSAVTALRSLHVGRVALVHPPWFDDELNDLGAAYFGSQGFAVVSSESTDLANDPQRIEPGAIVEWISRHLGDDAEAVFIGGNGFRAARVIQALEERLERPVLESNQVLLWSILAELDADLEVGGYGRLFGEEPGGPLIPHPSASATPGPRNGDELSQPPQSPLAPINRT
jgi:maleate isomerase